MRRGGSGPGGAHSESCVCHCVCTCDGCNGMACQGVEEEEEPAAAALSAMMRATMSLSLRGGGRSAGILCYAVLCELRRTVSSLVSAELEARVSSEACFALLLEPGAKGAEPSFRLKCRPQIPRQCYK